jgi:hypothetical protein
MTYRIFICEGGPVYKLAVGKRQYVFEMHPYCGPMWLRHDGEPLNKFVPENSPRWAAFEQWQRGGMKVDEFSRCVLDPDASLPLAAKGE